MSDEEQEDTPVNRAVLFVDVAGSTRLIAERGDARARTILDECLGIMSAIARSGGGREVDRKGDEIMCAFADTAAAASTACAIQRRLAESPPGDEFEHPVRVRMGFAYGPVIDRAGVLFGRTVNLAARLVGLAKAGQILTTAETLVRLDQDLRPTARHFDRCILKGLPGEQEIHEILWDAQVTAIGRRPTIVTSGETLAIQLEYEGRCYRVDASRPRLELGRDPACDICVDRDTVSRLHATVEWNRGLVRLEDVSTNGTAVELPGRLPVRLHHQGTILSGNGSLLLGVEGGRAARVVFHCETRFAY